MAVPSAIDYLINAQHANGGWGYGTNHMGMVEPSAVVLMALRDEPAAKDAFQRGVTWLLNCQHQDGGWGINEDDPESGWQTAWAMIVAKAAKLSNEVIAKAADWLTVVPTYEISREEFTKGVVPKDASSIAMAWPWLPGQAGWIEPTALAVLALDGVVVSDLAQTRIEAALEYFKQYRTPSGGWNVGNAGPLDTLVIPRVYPTALVLIALTHRSKEDIQPIDLSAVEQDLLRDEGMLAQAAGLLALRISGKDDVLLATRLIQHQLSDGSWEHNPFVTAWAVIGLRGYL